MKLGKTKKKLMEKPKKTDKKKLMVLNDGHQKNSNLNEFQLNIWKK